MSIRYLRITENQNIYKNQLKHLWSGLYTTTPINVHTTYRNIHWQWHTTQIIYCILHTTYSPFTPPNWWNNRIVEVPPDGTVQELISDIIGYPYWKGIEYKGLESPLKDIRIGYESQVISHVVCRVHVTLFGKELLFDDLRELRVKVAVPDRNVEAFVSHCIERENRSGILK